MSKVMTSRPTVSVIVDNFNYDRFLPDAIESSLSQTYHSVEVIVVDDGSTDQSHQVIRSYGDRIQAVMKANGGQGSAFNAGLAVSRGELILFLDADDLLLPTAVETAVPLFDDQNVVTVHWPLHVIDEFGRRTGELFPHGELADGDQRDVVIAQGPDSYPSAPTSGHAWRRRLLDAALPIPETDYVNGADGYLITVAPLLGTIKRLTEPQACYRVHGRNAYWCSAIDDRIHRSLVRYERRVRSLADRLHTMGIPADPALWKTRNPYYLWMRRVQAATEEIKAIVPAGATFVLIDEAQWGSDPVTGRRSLPFLEHQGQYWGPPPDAETAVAELERMRRGGATFLVVGWPAFWWLDYYVAFHHHLRTTYPCRLDNERLVVFDLRQPRSFQ